MDLQGEIYYAIHGRPPDLGEATAHLRQLKGPWQVRNFNQIDYDQRIRIQQ